MLYGAVFIDGSNLLPLGNKNEDICANIDRVYCTQSQAIYGSSCV